jgi:hypothetical protein
MSLETLLGCYAKLRSVGLWFKIRKYGFRLPDLVPFGMPARLSPAYIGS